MSSSERPTKQQAFLALLREGWTSLHLDARRAGVVVPEALRGEPHLVLQYGHDLPIAIPDLEIDEYGARQPNLSYLTLSLYLDSDRLDTYWHAINGNRNRFKLRLRYYDDQPDTPVFFEIKRRDNNVILKERGGVRKSAVPLLLAGHMPERQHMLNRNDSEAFLAVQRFCHLMRSLDARPKMHVACLREAYENPRDNNVRVTMDRQVGSQPNPHRKKGRQNPLLKK